MKKKTLAMVLASALMVSLFAGCGDTTSTTSGGSSSVSTDNESGSTFSAELAEEYGIPADADLSGCVIGYCGNGSNDAAWIAMEAGVEAAAKDFGCTIYMTKPQTESDQAEASAAIDDLVIQGITTMVMAPPDAAGSVSTVDKLYDKGIPTVTMNLDTESENRVSFVSNDDIEDSRKAGVFIGEWVEENYDGQGTVVVLNGALSYTAGVQRREGVLAGLADFPDLKVVEYATEWDDAKALQCVEDALNAYDDVVAVFSPMDGLTLAAYSAVNAVGKGGEICIVGTDAWEDVLNLLVDGVVMADVGKNPYNTGYLAAVTAIKAYLGIEVDPSIDPGSMLITTENIHDYAVLNMIDGF